jgi:Methyltransferase TYW3
MNFRCKVNSQAKYSKQRSMSELLASNDLRIFSQQKLTCLSKADLSRKGSVDEPILDLIHFINDCERYFSTSSCSGRICLFEEPEVLPWQYAEKHRICLFLLFIFGENKYSYSSRCKDHEARGTGQRLRQRCVI